MVNMGLRMRKLREQKNLTQIQLAALFGLRSSTICSYEAGTRTPSYEILIKYAAHFHTTTDYIIYGSDKEFIDISDLESDEIKAIENLIEEYRNSDSKKKSNETKNQENT